MICHRLDFCSQYRSGNLIRESHVPNFNLCHDVQCVASAVGCDVACRIRRWTLDAAWCSFLLIGAQFAPSAARCGVSLVAIPVDGCSLPHASLGATIAFCIQLMDVVSRICCWMQRLSVVSFLSIDCCSLPHPPLDAAPVWLHFICFVCLLDAASVWHFLWMGAVCRTRRWVQHLPFVSC
jgi:hypothetical protein